MKQKEIILDGIVIGALTCGICAKMELNRRKSIVESNRRLANMYRKLLLIDKASILRNNSKAKYEKLPKLIGDLDDLLSRLDIVIRTKSYRTSQKYMKNMWNDVKAYEDYFVETMFNLNQD